MNNKEFFTGVSLGFTASTLIAVILISLSTWYNQSHPKVDIDTASATMCYGTMLALHGQPAYFTNKNEVDNFFEYCLREHGLARP